MFQQLQEIMTENAMVSRSEEGLTSALTRIKELTDQLNPQPVSDVSLAVRTRRLSAQLETASSILWAELLRRESRGSHFRTDFPIQDPALDRRILIKKDASGIHADFE